MERALSAWRFAIPARRILYYYERRGRLLPLVLLRNGSNSSTTPAFFRRWFTAVSVGSIHRRHYPRLNSTAAATGSARNKFRTPSSPLQQQRLLGAATTPMEDPAAAIIMALDNTEQAATSTSATTAPAATLSSTTTTTTTTMAPTTKDPFWPDVELVWNRNTEDGTLTVSLVPTTDSKEEPPCHPSVSSSSIPSTTCTPASNTSSSLDKQDTSNNESTTIFIPEAVLTYERQMRKAQHAKKLGRALHPHEDLQVVYVDEFMVVVDKPPGVLTVPGVHNNQSCLLHLVHAQYCNHDNDNDNIAAPAAATWIVHRLDMDTSGLVVFGRTPDVTRTLHATFRDRRVVKEYECLVVGHVPSWWDQDDDHDPNDQIQDTMTASTTTSSSNTTTSSSILIDLPLQKDHRHPPFMRVATPRSRHEAQLAVHQLQRHGWKKLVAKPAKASQTLVRVVERGCTASTRLPYTRLRLIPITGRTHQLRVHCAALGHPIVGDPTYGHYGEAASTGGIDDINMIQALTPETTQLLPRGTSLSLQKAWTAHHPPNDKPMCLHAAMLGFPHPVTGVDMKWEVPPKF